jgi:hypothetical protein
VIHYTAMPTAEAAIDRLCDSRADVSAHYLIDRYGAVTRMVDETMRAWHAGAGEWRGLSDINSRSIGIELDNLGDHPFPEPQMIALEDLRRGWPGRGSRARRPGGHSRRISKRRHGLPDSRPRWIARRFWLRPVCVLRPGAPGPKPQKT